MRRDVETLSRQLLKRWVPKWHDAFSDDKHGGFHERLGEKFKPLDMPYKRLLTQCRQISIYAHATTVATSPDYRKDLDERLKFMVKCYEKHKGGWIFSVTPDGKQTYDGRYDLYAHAFVIFTLSWAYRALKQEWIKDKAKDTLDFIHNRFALKHGYAEELHEDTLDPGGEIRRQNPHMHLFEACLFAYQTFDEAEYLAEADHIYSLFENHFFDLKSGVLREFFTKDLKPHPEEYDKIEPGHHFEWVWLLHSYGQLQEKADRTRLQERMRTLLNWGNKYGWDRAYGGIYNTLSPIGEKLDSNKRIWPFTEGLKANAMMLDLTDDKAFLKRRTDQMISIFRKHYMLPRGLWTEILGRDLSPQTDYLPGTTPYHLYFGVMETLRYLKHRGKSKSIGAAVMGALYNIRRTASLLFKSIIKP